MLIDIVAMEMETKFVHLFRCANLGDRIDGWRVGWVGGWDKCNVVFVVMVERPLTIPREKAGLNERRFHLDSAIGSESRPPAIVLRSLAASFWEGHAPRFQ